MLIVEGVPSGVAEHGRKRKKRAGERRRAQGSCAIRNSARGNDAIAITLHGRIAALAGRVSAEEVQAQREALKDAVEENTCKLGLHVGLR